MSPQLWTLRTTKDGVKIMFKTRINVQLREDRVAELVRRTANGYELVLYLNIFDKHFCYIFKSTVLRTISDKKGIALEAARRLRG